MIANAQAQNPGKLGGESPTGRGGIVPSHASDADSLLVVVVDDQSAGRRILEQVIRGIGADIRVASFDDAAAALAFVRAETPDLIVTDYLMPGMDGVGFIRRVRLMPGCDDVPIIVVTVVEDRQVRYRSLDAGATDFLSRPIDEHECRARCRNLLTLRRQQQIIKARALALQETERRFRIMADELPLVIWVQDTAGAVAFVNKTGCDFFGLPEAELAGRRWQQFVHPDDRGRYLAAAEASFPARQPHQDQCRVRRADGQWRWIETFARPYQSPQGVFAGVVGACLDITERKAAEESLRLSHLELERRGEQLARLSSQLSLTEQRERKRLAQVIHDDLQQLLVGAAFSIERAGRRLDDSAGGAAARDALNGTGALLRQAIEVARTLVGDLSPPILHEVGLAAALDWLARRMQQRFGLNISLDLDRAVAPQHEHLRCVLFEAAREALFNVVKHADCSEVHLALSCAANGWPQVVVEDDGVGFDVPTRLGDGSDTGGFGLFSMRERLHLLGGDLRIESRPGAGTRVVLTAPPVVASCGSAEVPGSVHQVMPAAVVAAAGVAPAADLRILLVDDHAMMRRALSSMLEGESGLSIAGEAADGIEAVAAVERLQPDMVLMDFSMPRMDGVEATRSIKQRWPRVRVIGLSMHEQADRAQAMLNAGASAYVCKSGDVELLLQTIQRVSMAEDSEGRV